MKQQKLGSFGEFVKQYEKARRPYPKEAFEFLKSKLINKNPKILDLGCGTGISTRQLVKVGEVIGCDPDVRMLRAAKLNKWPGNIKYVVGRADKLPFKDESFDIVSAFSSFHWFDNKKSIKEIKRVLKPDGFFIAVNNTGIKSFGQDYRSVIIKSIGQEVAQFKSAFYNPRRALQNSDFRNIKVKTWKNEELYSLKNILEFIQSVSIWSTVPKHLRLKALEGLKEYFKEVLASKGEIKRKMILKVVLAKK